MKETCRLCLRVETSLTSIFSKGKRFERLRSRILDCCPVTLFEDDSLPTAICDGCRRKVAITYEFREQCRKSERTLRSRYRSSWRCSESNPFVVVRVVRDRSVQTEAFDRSETRMVRGEAETEAEAGRTVVIAATTEQEEENESLSSVFRLDEEEGKRRGSEERREVKEKAKSEEGGYTGYTGTGSERRVVGLVDKSRKIEEDGTAGEKPYLCDVCSKTFVSKSGLRFHLKSHNAAKPYQCRHCGKGFVIPSYAKRHERIHGGEKRFVCHVCSAAFASSNGLKYHLRSHTGEPGYRCEICDKSFYRRKYLREHVYTHTGEKPFVCKTCGSCYGNSGSLFVHEKRCNVRTINSERLRCRRQTRQAQQQEQQ